MNVSFTLYPIAPYRLDYTVFALRRRSKNCVDCWNGQYYTRVLNLDNKPIKVVVEQTNSLNNPELLVSLNEPVHPLVQEKIKHLIEMMLGLNRDLTGFYKMAKDDVRLDPLVFQFMGVKPPCFPSFFEALINAISCQQISLDAGLHIQNRLVQHIGMKMNHENQVYYAFPTAEDVGHCSVAELKKIGYSTHKSETIVSLASMLKEEHSFLNRLEDKPTEEVIQLLCQFKGIGRWTAEYVLLRGLGRIEVFPGDDIGAQNNLQKLLHLEDKLDYKKTSKITALWHPYAGLVYFHLLLKKLDEKGAL
ncbi:DNA-3-methyladenine glycosylase family protein [Legionella longbeachae]|uniref:DNA-3-methyladenine glycosylase II n=1 Tax=Legionella longbeachae serogroup 1 (strain NSW150) TaxID=661367 RepID=D3HQ38_LEGLN|nr:DNA-3-methyladenine glycosylase [Legionella longbeachae]HBD7396284.1 DNA-3-methyladenine glycosylase 2 family protein [Legionella pneumophila]ARB92124.1 DNA-3-methyladenine glycosylase 2 family protein [Legionella longbeachae]ARM34697.1 DNA-3-methyladenine glycosylase 2 family protein [Legionella longbeachae]QEY50636.1 DNA-3-methyladenine glycosylase 2 family protein [Legionella longbeachae]QIN31459.1 DNA-3-methyladenine glycosylase 2 family protein [Legionella longbeachae]